MAKGPRTIIDIPNDVLKLIRNLAKSPFEKTCKAMQTVIPNVALLALSFEGWTTLAAKADLMLKSGNSWPNVTRWIMLKVTVPVNPLSRQP